MWSREQFPIEVAFALSMFCIKDADIEAAVIDVESIPADNFGQRMQRGLVYSAVGNLANLSNQLKGIRGLFHNRELLAYKVQPWDKAVSEDAKAQLGCVLVESGTRPAPAPVRGARDGLDGGGPDTTNTQLLKSLVDLMTANLEVSKNIEQKVRYIFVLTSCSVLYVIIFRSSIQVRAV
jgi:hypothetical protein